MKAGTKLDQNKPQWSLLPFKQLEDVVKVLTAGVSKYAPYNWVHVPNAKERYFSACMRHLSAWKQGEQYDPETKLPHLSHAICCLLFIGWFDDGQKNDKI